MLAVADSALRGGVSVRPGDERVHRLHRDRGLVRSIASRSGFSGRNQRLVVTSTTSKAAERRPRMRRLPERSPARRSAWHARRASARGANGAVRRPHRTTDDATTWVVLTGAPSTVAPSRTAVEPLWLASASMGRIRMMRRRASARSASHRARSPVSARPHANSTHGGAGSARAHRRPREGARRRRRPSARRWRRDSARDRPT